MLKSCSQKLRTYIQTLHTLAKKLLFSLWHPILYFWLFLHVIHFSFGLRRRRHSVCTLNATIDPSILSEIFGNHKLSYYIQLLNRAERHCSSLCHCILTSFSCGGNSARSLNWVLCDNIPATDTATNHALTIRAAVRRKVDRGSVVVNLFFSVGKHVIFWMLRRMFFR